MAKSISHYKFIPIEDGGVVVEGFFQGRLWRTSRVNFFRKGEVKTASGTIYHLSKRSSGFWIYNLQALRPEVYAKLAKAGLV